MLNELTHAVQYRYHYATCDVGWHTMAAFDSEQVATGYMCECRDDGDHDHLEYRVVPVPQEQEPPQPVDDGSCDPLYGQRMDSADMGEN